MDPLSILTFPTDHLIDILKMYCRPLNVYSMDLRVIFVLSFFAWCPKRLFACLFEWWQEYFLHTAVKLVNYSIAFLRVSPTRLLENSFLQLKYKYLKKFWKTMLINKTIKMLSNFVPSFRSFSLSRKEVVNNQRILSGQQ